MEKRITVEKLAECLQKLEPENTVEVNAVGNLLIRDSQENPIGYVDFLDGEVESWNELKG